MLLVTLPGVASAAAAATRYCKPAAAAGRADWLWSYVCALQYRLNELWKAGELEQLLHTYLDTRVNVSLVRKAGQAYSHARRPVAMQAGQTAQAVADASTFGGGRRSGKRAEIAAREPCRSGRQGHA